MANALKIMGFRRRGDGGPEARYSMAALLYDFDANCAHVAVPENGLKAPREMTDELVGTGWPLPIEAGPLARERDDGHFTTRSWWAAFLMRRRLDA